MITRRMFTALDVNDLFDVGHVHIVGQCWG